MIRILFQGDSITDGNRYKDPAKRWDLNHQIGHSYVFQIAGILGRRYIGKYCCINRGVSGDTVESISERWQRDTLDENPDILSLLLGVNGNGKWDGYYPEGTEEHLRNFDAGYRRLLDSAAAQNPAIQFILIEPFVLPVGSRKIHYADFFPVFQRKQKIIQQIAEDYHAVWIPVQEKLQFLAEETERIGSHNLDPAAYWLWDGIHPTEAMHSFLADLWLEGAENILNQV
ncbi:MAG: lysophospholipase [Clostridia bacterium]|nr:lysophospholipase [Clostridia bacterium]